MTPLSYCYLLTIAAFLIFLFVHWLRQRVGVAAVKPVGKDGVMLAERLSEKKRWVMLKEKYGIAIGAVGMLAVIGLISWVCGSM